jgi:hypothetical protein
MKYIVFWEYKPENVAKVIEKALQSQAMTEKMTERELQNWPTTIFPPHTIRREENKIKGFTIVDATDSAQIARSIVYWFPELIQQYVPINDNMELIKIYQEQTS